MYAFVDHDLGTVIFPGTKPPKHILINIYTRARRKKLCFVPRILT